MNQKSAIRAAVVAVLVAASTVLAVYFHVFLRTGVVYLHLAYVPAVLAAVWWGRKGMAVAAILALLVVGMRICGVGAGELWNDVIRVAFLLLVAFCVAVLSEKLTRSNRALRRSEGNYRALFERSLAGIMVYRDERVLLANERFTAMLGRGAEDLKDVSIWDLVYEPDRPMVRKMVARRQAGIQSDLHYECRLKKKNGVPVWVDLASSTIHHLRRPVVLVYAYDITDRKESTQKEAELRDLARRQEEQLVHSTRLAELGEMAAAVAHELNQPLTGIRNYAKNAVFMVENGVGDAAQVKDNLQRIAAQVDRAARIIGRMRELTRKGEKEFGPVDLNQVVRESLEFLAPQLRLSRVEVDFSPAADLPEAWGDRIRLEQVILNLLTNARQAMEDSRVRRLSVRTYADPAAQVPLVLEVTDTGSGFTQEQGRHLFAPFYSTKRPGQGTGLGLSISLSIIKDHDGSIDAFGETGKGATFTVRLPARPSDSERIEKAGNE